MKSMATDLAINQRVAGMKPSATLAMSARAKARRRAGFPVIALSAGEPDFGTPAPVAQAAIEAIQEGFTHYTENRGMLELREEICRKLAAENGISYDPEEILCSNGAKQSVAQAIAALCGEGDEVLIPAPYWVSYPEMARFAGATPVYIPTSVETEYMITAGMLERALTERTRVLMLCSPSNPTGGVYDADAIASLVEVLHRHPNVLVLSDEIYERVVYDATHTSIASLPGMRSRTITVNGFSKSYAMTGWRLGYMAADRSIVREAAKIQSQFTSAPNSISQKAGLAALRMGDEHIDPMVEAFRERRDFVLASLGRIGDIRCPVPEGAFYVFPDISALYGRRTPGGDAITDSEQFCYYVLDEFNVALVPGHAFGGPDGVRISYAASMDDLVEAMSRFASAVQSLG